MSDKSLSGMTTMTVSRREFLQGTMAATSTLALAGSVTSAAPFRAEVSAARGTSLRFVPHFDQFRLLATGGIREQMKLLSELGFTTLDDRMFRTRPTEVQREMVNALAAHGMRLGTIQGPVEFRGPSIASTNAAVRETAHRELTAALDTAQATGAEFCTHIPGRALWSSHRGHRCPLLVEEHRIAAEAAAARGVTLLLEPVNLSSPRGTKTSSMLVRTLEDAFQLCDAVAHPSFRVLCDVYEWCETTGNNDVQKLLPLLDQGWSHLGAVHVGDMPGRKEPGTGVFDFVTLLAFLEAHGFSGPVAMDHGASRPGHEGELAVLKAYEPFSGSLRLPE
jgi:hydroxypyruvate isomerase